MNLLFPMLETFIAMLFIFVVGAVAVMVAGGILLVAFKFVTAKVKELLSK